MTSFEAQSIFIAEWALGASIAADIITLVGIIAGFISIILVLKQRNSDQWSTLLSLEQDMDHRKERFIEIGERLAKTTDPSEIGLIQQSNDAAKESYLNAMDRLAAMILNGQFPQKELKSDYRQAIKDIVTKYQQDFGAATPYRRIKKLYDKWEDE